MLELMRRLLTALFIKYRKEQTTGMAYQFFTERKAALELGIGRSALRKYRRMGLIAPIITQSAVLYSMAVLNKFATSYVVSKGKPIAQR
jgi:hypothetical protein